MKSKSTLLVSGTSIYLIVQQNNVTSESASSGHILYHALNEVHYLLNEYRHSHSKLQTVHTAASGVGNHGTAQKVVSEGLETILRQKMDIERL